MLIRMVVPRLNVIQRMTARCRYLVAWVMPDLNTAMAKAQGSLRRLELAFKSEGDSK